MKILYIAKIDLDRQTVSLSVAVAVAARAGGIAGRTR
jgi:hypothetical protein